VTAPTKLHLGCGAVHQEGFVNVDVKATAATDLVASACDLSMIGDGTVERIETYHMIEHISEEAAHRAACEWLRVLIPGGALVVECPNLTACCKGIAKGHPGERGWRLAFGGIFGQIYRPDMGPPAGRAHRTVHRWGWTPETLIAMLGDAGFVGLVRLPATRHTRWRDMRIEGRKPE